MNIHTIIFLSRSRNFSLKSISFLNNFKINKQCYCTFISQKNVLYKNMNRHQFNVLNGQTWNFSTEPNKNEELPNNKLPPLMQFPKLIWPSLGKSIKNFFLTNIIIKPYMDNEFSLPEFILGSKKAVEVVSNKLSTGEVKTLVGLVADDIIPSLQARLSLMSLTQREQLVMNEADIYFSFPYQVGIIFNDDENDQKRFVEITMVHHALKGLSGMRSRGEEVPLNLGLLPEYQNKICIANYRFIKEFTKGVESDWTVNLVNHFKPIDDLEEK
ncbi:hypothetical protein HHI36_003333 [Cryptolaemus montrouzieri]|uniref:Uncharacterized protein n=1 Tax=Cryptolaemus montrouzieri TaxID=559131 RepID=A0ABD2PD45_9CUCU